MADYPVTGQDVLTHFLRRVGELFPTDTALTSGAGRLQDAKIHCMTGYYDLCAFKPWRWARKDPPVQFNSRAPVTNGVSLVPLVPENPTVTLDTAIDIAKGSVAGGHFMLDGEAIPARIAQHTAGTNVLTLATGYTGTNLIGSCTIFFDELFVASDVLAFPRIQEMHLGDMLVMLPEDEMRRRFPRNVNGQVRALYGSWVTDQKVRIVPWTTQARLFECAYNARPDVLTFDGNPGTDTPVCPPNLRELIGLFGLRRLMTDKRDQRIQVIQAEIQERLQIAGGVEVSFSKPRVSVPPGQRIGGR